MKLETNKSGYFFSKKIQKNLDKFRQNWKLIIPDILFPNKSKKIQINLDKYGFYKSRNILSK